MTRVIIWGWSIGSMSVAIEKLKQEGLLDVVMWVTPDNVKQYRPKYFSYVPDVMLEQQADFERRSDVYYSSGTDQINRDLCKFMDIYSRVNYSKGRDYHDHVNLFHLYYSYFTNILKKENIESIFFMGAPHVGVDYILYLAAKAQGVDTVLTFQSHIRDRFFCTTDLQDYGTFTTSPVAGQSMSVEIPRTYRKDLYYMLNAKHKRGLRLHKFVEDLARTIIPNRQPISLAGVFQNLSNRINYVRYYRKQVVDQVDYDRKFVYFPLQMQPELTTSALGNEYSDQLLAVEKISAMLPDNWSIYVKENPKQSASQRNRLFYERLSRIKNCYYLNEGIDTYDLIEHCQFVSAITGTVCWEAISGGKSALVFGVSWYMTLPGVVVYREGLEVDDVMAEEFTHEELERAHNALMSKSIPGNVGMEYELKNKTEIELENEKHIYDFYKAVLTASSPKT